MGVGAGNRGMGVLKREMDGFIYWGSCHVAIGTHLVALGNHSIAPAACTALFSRPLKRYQRFDY